mmetsp:Transcript_162963/g.517585  ORF Transcript_162963/g.517585 Transcript_162963/m.517585 type:complete len:106 (+) Transcript_162963:2684-3001(+)
MHHVEAAARGRGLRLLLQQRLPERGVEVFEKGGRSGGIADEVSIPIEGRDHASVPLATLSDLMVGRPWTGERRVPFLEELRARKPSWPRRHRFFSKGLKRVCVDH